MKEKRQKTRWTLYSFSNKFVFNGIIFFTKILPLSILRIFSFFIAIISYLLLKELKKVLIKNFSIYIKNKKNLKKTIKKCFISYTRGVVDFWYGALRDHKVLFDLDEKDRKPFLNFKNILLTAHAGNWELGAIYLKMLGVPFVVFAQPEEDPKVEENRKMAREKFGIETYYIDSGESLPFVAKKILNEGKSIIMLADRAFKKDFIKVNFFGEKVCFLKSPFLLSKWTKVPICPIYFMMENKKYKGFTFNPIKPTLSIEEMTEKFSRTLEEILWHYPEQWYNFFDYLKYSNEILKRK